nr:helicase associated domain-containing protein [Bacillus toyonensis]
MNFELEKEYYRTNGNLLVHKDYITNNTVRLGKWIVTQLQIFKGQQRASFLTQEQIKKLNVIGMVWDKNDYDWNFHYGYAKEYFLNHGNLLVS